MLKRLIILFFCLVLFASLGNDCCATPVTYFSKDSTILIIPFPISNPTPPKAPAVVPISASYEALLTSIVLTFFHYLGEIEVEVTNTTSCSYTSIIVDTQYLYAIIPLTFGAGHYIILFTLPSGQQYQSELDIS